MTKILIMTLVNIAITIIYQDYSLTLEKLFLKQIVFFFVDFLEL